MFVLRFVNVLHLGTAESRPAPNGKPVQGLTVFSLQQPGCIRSNYLSLVSNVRRAHPMMRESRNNVPVVPVRLDVN